MAGPASNLLQQEGYDLMAAAFEVYNEQGYGLLEEIYQESLEIELALRAIPFVSKQQLIVCYKGKPLKKHYVPDLFVFGRIIVELKAVQQSPEHEAQLLNYLAITGCSVGYLLNFGSRDKLEWKRLILTRSRRPKSLSGPVQELGSAK